MNWHRSAMSFAPLDPAAARAWLTAAGLAHRSSVRSVGLLAIGDIGPAIILAAGIGMIVGGLAAEEIMTTAIGVGLASAGLFSRGLLQALGLIRGTRLAADVKTGLRVQLMQTWLSASRPDANQVTAAVEGIEALDGYWSRFVSARYAATVSPLLAIAACAFASPVAAGVLTATLLPFVVGMALAGSASATESRRQFQALERLSGLFLDRIRALPAILSFQAEDRVADEIGASSRELAERTENVLRVAFLSSGVLEFFSALSVALVAIYCGFNLLGLLPFPAPEQLSLTQAFFVLAMAPEVYAPIRRLAAAYHDRQAAEAAAPLLEPCTRPVSRARYPIALADPPSIRFEDVGVRFGNRVVVEGFSLSIRPGETVALRGVSGTGKTTLLKVLLGLAPVSTGMVVVNEIDLDARGDLSSVIAWAGQSPVVLAGTLAENIDLGRSGASRDAIQTAARRAGLHMGLDRPLDERGGGLSGGERRRLGLARVILKDAPIVLLDEPTANLDKASEQALLSVIEAACHGRTCLIATHSDSLAAVASREISL